MFHDSKLVEPDLSKPSVRGLAWLLRHPERWPADFEFDFWDSQTCAKGLAHRQWPNDIPSPLFGGWRALGITEAQANSIFEGKRLWRTRDLSPEAIADDLDALAGRLGDDQRLGILSAHDTAR
jgi:hypothetical protein